MERLDRTLHSRLRCSRSSFPVMILALLLLILSSADSGKASSSTHQHLLSFIDAPPRKTTKHFDSRHHHVLSNDANILPKSFGDRSTSACPPYSPSRQYNIPSQLSMSVSLPSSTPKPSPCVSKETIRRCLVGSRRAMIRTNGSEQTWYLFEAATMHSLEGKSSMEAADCAWVYKDEEINLDGAISVINVKNNEEQVIIEITDGDGSNDGNRNDEDKDSLETILAAAIAKINPSHNGATITDARRNKSESKTISMEDTLSSDPSLLFPIQSSKCEWVDIVDSTGDLVLGSAPRILVHKYNLLHLGIGIVVTDDGGEMMQKDIHDYDLNDKGSLPSIYVHRRTDTKRIFPSLYDMFVGGVSTSNEKGNLLMTARRELEEELGLSREDGFTNGLFRCIVCTSYNRCVVQVYQYRCYTEVEEVKWQEDEVAWGEFVPYDVVEEAASLSISRLQASKTWPGENVEATSASVALTSEDDGAWRQWDFVPDGLLVWEAWRAWVKNK